MKIAIRADASVYLGTGHIMRCLSLADAFPADSQITFFCKETEGHLAKVVTARGYTVVLRSIADTCSETDEAALWRQHTGNAAFDLLIVDHYALGATFCRAMRQHSAHILVIDDLANRRLDGDFLLDQNLFANLQQRYEGLVPVHCKRMLGPEFALLRDEFYQTWASPQGSQVLIGFGGSDEQNLTARCAQVLTRLKLHDIAVDIVIGAGYPYAAALKDQVAQMQNVRLHQNCGYMAKLMQRATLMIGSGGTTHWERCISGLPGLIVTTADNQTETTRCLAEAGACDWLCSSDSFDAELLATKLNYYFSHPEALQAMATQAKRIVPSDGGAKKVVKIIEQSIRGE